MAETTRPSAAPGRFAQAFGLLAAPVAYALVAFVTYAVAPTACQSGWLQTSLAGNTALAWLTFLVALAGLLLTILGAVVAYQNWVRSRAAGMPADERSRFVAVGGILVSVVFIGLTLFAGLSGLAFRPCDPV